MDGPQIIAHGDFDGIVSAALAGLWSGIALFFYTGPESVRRIEMTARDIVCDLPHPMRDIRAWFDHHASNIEEARATGWSAGEGAAHEAPSAARVIFEHLKDRVEFPEFAAATVVATDHLDLIIQQRYDKKSREHKSGYSRHRAAVYRHCGRNCQRVEHRHGLGCHFGRSSRIL